MSSSENSTGDSVEAAVPTGGNVTEEPSSQPGELDSTVLVVLLFVLITGVIGCIANGSVLIALVADKKLQKYCSTFLIKYQIWLDFVSCVLLVISYSMKVVLDGDPDTMRRWGTVVCMFFIGDGLTTIAMNVATVNLAMIALERYVKIVHSVKHRYHFRRWMLYLAVVFTILQSILVNIPMAWTSVIDEAGICHVFSLWADPASLQGYSMFLAVWLYAGLLAFLVYCYGRIILKLNKTKSTVSPDNIAVNSAASSQNAAMNRSQINVIKSMILISVTYALTSFLYYFGYVVYAFDSNTSLIIQPLYYASIASYILNAWLDPFIYVMSHKDVRQQFLHYLLCFNNY